MARIFVEQQHEYPDDWDEKHTHIYLAHQLGPSYSQEVARSFGKENNVDVIEQEVSMGGGGFESVSHWLLTAVTFSFMLMANGFFSEIGASGAKRIAQLLKKKSEPSAIVIRNKRKHFTVKVFLPKNLSEKECEIALHVIDEFVNSFKTKRSAYIVLIYDKKSETLHEYDKNEW